MAAPQPGWAWGRTLKGYCKFWAPRRQQSPLPNFYLLAGSLGGWSSETHRTSSLQNITKSLLVQNPSHAPPSRASGSTCVRPEAQGVTVSRGEWSSRQLGLGPGPA